MPQKIIQSYTPQMQADEKTIRAKLGLADGVAGGGGRSKAIAYAITKWTTEIDQHGQEADDPAKLAPYVEEYVRSSYMKVEGAERTSLYFKELTLAQMEVIGDHLAKLQERVPMLLPVLKPSGQRKVSAYNHTLIVMLALAREARGAK